MILDNVTDLTARLWEYFRELDIDYLSWVLWVIYPVIISFILPAIILVFLYASALFLVIFHYRERLRAAYQHDIWDGARKTLAALWSGQGFVTHGFEIDGLDNLPEEGPALIIYYHGVVPIDIYYVMAKCLLEKGRLIHAVGDNFLFRIPGWRKMMEVLNVTPGTVQSCVDVLSRDNLLAIAPGGVREALFSDENYSIMWGKRTGFAKVALQANVPVIPMFTENVREAFRTPQWGRTLLRRLYEYTRLPIVPIYGIFPVKLVTHFGEPIYPEPGSTPEDFRDLVQTQLEDLIRKHQRLPSNIPRSLFQRFWEKPKNS
ncbi:DGAT1/2-independent enzyme synthesizing storage lipids-like [Littorina saxatilis]|uniref:Phospholipid/glycerol acyltransferase domain-containing protein n=1 Tax=Littorina saxatilis TaxID=31220 RepID=A0AAN9B7Q5_9CAEN